MAYHTRQDLEDRYGVANVARMADLDCDGNAQKIANRINRAIATSDALVDDILRAGPWSGTLPVEDATGSPPKTITDAAVRLSGYWLSTARGVKDYDEKGRPLSRYYVDYLAAMDLLNGIRDQQIRIDGVL